MAGTNKAGRTRSYTEAQLNQAIDAVIADGQEPADATVRAKLVAMFDISPQISSPTLVGSIKDVLADRRHAEDAARIAALPEAVRQAVGDLAADLERRMLATGGLIEERAQRRIADARAELEIVVGTLRERTREHERARTEWQDREADLLAADAAKAERIAALEAEVARLAAMSEERRSMEAMMQALLDRRFAGTEPKLAAE